MLDTTIDAQDDAKTYEHDSRLFVVFYNRPLKAEFKSEQAGRPIFEDIEHVRIMVPGDKNTVIDTPVIESHRQRFPNQYAKFKKMQEQAPEGTPLEQWPQLTASQVMEMKALGLFTVEQLSTLSDLHLQKIMGGNELKRKAATFLEVANNTAAAQKYVTENAELKTQVSALLDNQKQMAAQIDLLLKRDVQPTTPPATTAQQQQHPRR